MRPEKVPAPGTLPQTRNELQAWVREQLRLPAALETALLAAIDAVFSRHERLWQESKHEAIQALSAGFADKMSKVKHELSARDATVSSISRYFEQLVADLTDKTHRDPKTKLMNFGRFTEQLESFLALEQRGRWCAIGLVDITAFKWYNDALGHTVGDRIIERVAHLLREQVRVDVGVVCLWLGRLAERRFIARRLASALITQADKLMYEAKGERASHIYLMRVKIENGELLRISDDESQSAAG